MSSNPDRGQVLGVVVGGLVGIIIGFVLALIFCYYTWVRDLQVHLVAKEKALNEWAEINRQERATVATLKGMSADELRRWVASVDEQNTSMMSMQRRLHQLELSLTGPGTTYIIIAVCALLGVVGLVVFWLRDANREAATTLENVAALAPEDMVRAVLVKSLAARTEPLAITVEHAPARQRPRELPGSTTQGKTDT